MKIISIFLILSLSLNLQANIFTDKEEARKTGDVLKIAVPLYGVGLLFYNDDLEGFVPYAISLLAAQGSVEVLKRVVREKRPDKSDDLSFPSGHSAGAFSGATFIHKRYGFKQAAVPYVLASYVAYSRVKARKHYTHDVLAGAALAGISTLIFVKKAPNLSLEPRSDGFFLRYAKRF
ncbi:PAP2 family protein [Campylobacter sp. MIT 99-7217]|uniref:phosphatase PAP2 family protein n=1 Tax=Campylobacter sp. MIT 99-7217 TaxID=535091 RepID=UPI00115BA478|nr:phosphatase PAP2 family protein [Campylobacter sp. MIT 99-7217]TQR28781.1 PAP2 family protein [Campylobacter sp. MIT 99-7217]